MATLETNLETAAPPQTFRFSAGPLLSPARQESLGQWHRQFLRGAADSLTDLLRLPVELELGALELQSYSHILAQRGAESHSLLFRMQPQPGIWLLDLPTAFCLFVVERLMGGHGSLSEEPARELTEIEQMVFQQFSESLLGDYARGWKPHAELKPEEIRLLRQLKPGGNFGLDPEDLLLKVEVRVHLKDGDSHFSIIIPVAAVEDLLVRSGAAEENLPSAAPGLLNDKNSPMGSVPVPVSIRWQGFRITLREVEAMAPGDVLVLDNKKCENAVIWLANRDKFYGRVAREPQRTVVTLTGPVE